VERVGDGASQREDSGRLPISFFTGLRVLCWIRSYVWYACAIIICSLER
jgi:hypothetical protein